MTPFSVSITEFSFGPIPPAKSVASKTKPATKAKAAAKKTTPSIKAKTAAELV